MQEAFAGLLFFFLPRTVPDNKLLIGFAANADRYEAWVANPQPLRDRQQPFNGVAPLNAYPSGSLNCDTAGVCADRVWRSETRRLSGLRLPGSRPR